MFSYIVGQALPHFVTLCSQQLNSVRVKCPKPTANRTCNGEPRDLLGIGDKKGPLLSQPLADTRGPGLGIREQMKMYQD